MVNGKTEYAPTKGDMEAAQFARERGCPYQAQYILMFGYEAMEPNLLRQGIIPKNEQWYKKFVEGGHPWDWYYEYPEGTFF